MPTPLVKKLGIKVGMKARFIDAPVDYFDLLELPDIELLESGNQLADFIHVFAVKSDKLPLLIPQLHKEMEQTGMIWIS